MTNHDKLLIFRSVEFKYLQYITSQSLVIEKKYDGILNNRDFKLDTLLYNEISDISVDIKQRFKNIRDSINSLDIYNLDVKSLESIAMSVSDLDDFLNSELIPKIGEIENGNTST